MLTAIKLKQEGATAGVPDLFIPEPSQDKHGLWIEMKIKGGHLQDSQKAMIELLRERGYEVAVCFSFLEFRRAVLSYFGVDVNVGLSARDMQRKRFEEIKEELNKQKKTCKRQKKLM